MGIRETLNENRSVTTGAAIGITVLAVLWIVYYTFSQHQPPILPASRPVDVSTQ